MKLYEVNDIISLISLAMDFKDLNLVLLKRFCLEQNEHWLGHPLLTITFATV